METESYTPGHSKNATEFMAKRSIHTHGGFFLPYLEPGLSVLDCGCGPGSITLSIACLVSPGTVDGVDFGTSQIEQAKASALRAGIANAAFQTANCYSLPFPDATFDRVFSHALVEHLSDPVRALTEFFRVLRPGGVVGVCSPDWGGFLLAPPSAELSVAISAYTALQRKNGGDVDVGRKLGAYLQRSGFANVNMAARYECYTSRPPIGEYLALQLEDQSDSKSAEVLRNWSRLDGGMFAQCWVACTAHKLP